MAKTMTNTNIPNLSSERSNLRQHGTSHENVSFLNPNTAMCDIRIDEVDLNRRLLNCDGENSPFLGLCSWGILLRREITGKSRLRTFVRSVRTIDLLYFSTGMTR